MSRIDVLRPFIEKHLAAACDAVEAIKGRPFPKRPSARVTEPKELATDG